MSRTGPTRNALVAAIIAQGRANSTGTVLLHAAIAERLGLNPSDHKCADLMMSQSEPCTPGRLAELTGLSTGAITGVIDRLERAGFLVREHDAEDRRRVLLRLTHTRAPELQALFAPLAKGMEALCENYTIAELAVVLRFMREVRLVTDGIAEDLRGGLKSKATQAAAAQSRKPEQVDADTAVAKSVTAARRIARAADARGVDRNE
jgi:DNA-binding MarR family transcriptional regulator